MGESGKIFQAIPAIMAEIDAIGKNRRNDTQRFMYRGVDDVMNALNPALVHNKVFIAPEILEQSREDRVSSKGTPLIYSVCRMRFRFYAEDGSFVDTVTIGEGMDSGDKSTNKAMAVAFKYACFQVFCIPTEEMKDPDAESHTVQPKTASGGQKQAAQGNASQQTERPPQGNTARQNTTQASGKSEAQKNAEMTEQANSALIDSAKAKVIRDKIRQKGLAENSITAYYKVDCIADMTVESWMSAMKILDRYPDKEGAA